ncbi:hypothetical protein KC19_6G220200 [Ceratodon purpureus]|uniref:Uncharacterized protein n=1 Tax=Ceratodon purpureus TaxID=3225 RepID=A0A8T0HKC1_CERPU|nr:hypothetical protein KC19_6G220200 [Ceratodon purpureus]
MVQVLCEGGLGFVAMVELLVPLHSVRRPLVQPSRVVAAASLACCAVDVSSCGAPVQDATAAPPRTRDNYKLAPRTLALKTRKIRKRGSGRSDGEGDDGGDNSDGNCGGDGSWGGGENGRGGWDSWGESWNDESRRWDEGHDALSLLYQAACWLSLSKCVHYVIVKAVGWGREGTSSSVEEAPFARCSSVFLDKEVLGMPMVDKVMC